MGPMRMIAAIALTVLLSLAPLAGASEDEMIEHCAAVAQEMPLVGFYLQKAVGGPELPASFWRR